MGKQNSTVGLVWNIIGAALIGALLLAPLYYMYLLFRKTPKLTRNIEDYALADFEQEMLENAICEVSDLSQTHVEHLRKGLRLTKSGQFDKRSRDGREAAATKERLDEQTEAYEYLSRLPLARLSGAISGRKIKIAAGASLVALSFALIALKQAIERSVDNSDFFGMYLMSTGISVAVFAGIWVLASIWYWLSFRPIKRQLVASLGE